MNARPKLLPDGELLLSLEPFQETKAGMISVYERGLARSP
jgi:hypothetical protein